VDLAVKLVEPGPELPVKVETPPAAIAPAAPVIWLGKHSFCQGRAA
jgi:hypothetical protein